MITFYDSVYGKITRLPRPVFYPHFARRRAHLYFWERRFLLIFGYAQNAYISLYDRHSQIVSGVSFFARSRENVKKDDPLKTNGPKMYLFLVSKLLYPPNVGSSSIFPVSKMHEKLMKIAVFELLHGPFVILGWVFGRVSKKLEFLIQNAFQSDVK